MSRAVTVPLGTSVSPSAGLCWLSRAEWEASPIQPSLVFFRFGQRSSTSALKRVRLGARKGATMMDNISSVLGTRHRGTDEERFLQKFQKADSGCWEWRASVKSNGYGQFRGGGHIYAHRFSYEMFVGPIPDHYEVDHLCLVRHCVNPEHLEAITLQENRRRRDLRRTHCPSGHSYTEENTYLWTDKDGYTCRYCRTCRNGGRLSQSRKNRVTTIAPDPPVPPG